MGETGQILNQSDGPVFLLRNVAVDLACLTRIPLLWKEHIQFPVPEVLPVLDFLRQSHGHIAHARGIHYIVGMGFIGPHNVHINVDQIR